MLTAFGYQCRCVNNGREALEAWRLGQFDLVLMDCQMPEMDGYDAVRAIRLEEARSPQRQPVPIIALTAHATKGDRDRCLEAGMDDYLTKPLDPPVLETVLKKWLNKQSKAETAQAPEAELPPVDFRALLTRCMNKPELAGRLVRKLVEQAEQDVTAITTALQQNDAAALAAAAHRLKGASANVAAESLREIAHDLEMLGRRGDLSTAGALIPPLHRQLARLKKL
jgi:CheY-like chemotaxis protein